MYQWHYCHGSFSFIRWDGPAKLIYRCPLALPRWLTMSLRINETYSAVRTMCDFPKYTTSKRCHQHMPPHPQRCLCELNVPTALSVLHVELRLLLWGHHHQLLPLSRLMITDMCATGLMWSQLHQFDCGCWASSPVDGQHRPATCVEHWARDYGGGGSAPFRRI